MFNFTITMQGNAIHSDSKFDLRTRSNISAVTWMSLQQTSIQRCNSTRLHTHNFLNDTTGKRRFWLTIICLFRKLNWAGAFQHPTWTTIFRLVIKWKFYRKVQYRKVPRSHRWFYIWEVGLLVVDLEISTHVIKQLLPYRK